MRDTRLRLNKGDEAQRIPQKGFYKKDFTRAIVETIRNACDLIVCDGLEALRLWEVLAQQPIHVFIGSAFSGGVMMGKEKCGLPYFRGSPVFPLQVHPHPITLAIHNRCRDLPGFELLTLLENASAFGLFTIS